MSTRRQTLLLAAVLLIMLAAAFPMLTYPLGRDQGMYANIGHTILAGGVPYVDMWDVKPPPIYYLYAAAIALFGWTTEALRALDLIFMPLAALALYALGRTLSGARAGLFAVALLMAFYFTETFASLTQSDSLVLLPLTLAALSADRAARAQRATPRALLLAGLTGLLCGLIVWFKQYYLFFVLALIAHHMLTRRALPVKEAAAFVGGGLLSGGGLLMAFGLAGMLPEMLVIAQGTASYTAQGYATFFADMGHYLRFRWWHWGPLLILAALWWPLRWRGGAVEPGWRLVGLWLMAGLAFALIQAKGFDTHWLPMLPPLTLVAADSLQGLTSGFKAPRWRTLISAGVIVACALILANSTWARAFGYLTGAETKSAYYARFQANDVKPEESLAMVDYLRQRVAPGDTLYVWGFRPEVIYMGRWRPATRFQAHFPLVLDAYPADWRDENVAVLWAAMPPYVMVLQADYMPWVTNTPLDSHELLVAYDDLNHWLAAHYIRETQLGDFLVWRRQG